MSRKVTISQKGVRELLKSIEIQDALMNVAEDLVGGNQRYTIERDDTRQVRTAVAIMDASKDAIAHEARTGELGRLSKGLSK